MRWGQPSPSPNPIAFLGQNGQGFSSAQGWAKFLDPTGSSSGLSTPAWGLPTQRDCRSGSTAFLPLPLHVCWHSGLPCPRARVGRYSEQVLALQASCSASTLGRRALHKPQRASRPETPPGALHPPHAQSTHTHTTTPIPGSASRSGLGATSPEELWQLLEARQSIWRVRPWLEACGARARPRGSPWGP